MADWLPASTNEFWQETTYTLYLGSGQWSLTATSDVLTFKADNPVQLDGGNVFGVRFSYTNGAEVNWFEAYFDIYSGIPTDGTPPIELLLDVGDQVDGECINSITPNGWYGTVNGYNDLLISDIEIFTDWVPTGCVWTSYVNCIEYCE
jgi:hypothetical protein